MRYQTKTNYQISGLLLLLVLLTLSAFAPAHANELQDIKGRVILVADGDTFTMIAGSIGARNLKKVKVRLAEIDAPESDQAYGKEAKRSLMGMVMGKEVIVRVQDKDRRSRIVGRVYVQRSGEVIDVNGEQLRLGWAWVYPQYLKDQRLPAVEADARANHRGLWAQAESELVAPWDWRHNR